ncbi:DUF3089 domain-containing protein [Sphingomonas sp.]|uniref:DUF3089 domain-containing protein n=1 Tax=Sphingomonas sp. TaxID=28214 RepID=UPI00286D9204|nr:DUF3089 domain-containing protein [Sphingomonas sp.]
MCARRFLIMVFILTLLAVAAGFAIFQFGDRVLIRSATPRGHFTAPPPASGPDYGANSAWLARPGMADDPSRWLPDGTSAGGGDAVVFYIHPTTYLERDRWNAPLSGHADSDKRAGLFVRSQASALTGAGEVWAPRYRQAAFGAFLLKNEDATAALDLAYGDVRAAFDRFVAEAPTERPIILAGHSQGALHLMRLLKERVAGTPLQRRVAAAYVVGWPLSVTADVPALGLPACTAPDQAGCLLSWLSFAAPANPELVVDAYQGSPGLAGGKRKREDILCVNPLTGTRDGAAAPGANPGTLVPSADLASATLVPGRVGAQCDDGLLMLNGAIPALGPYVLPGNNYHVYDYALFWGAVRADAARRVAAWRR